MNIVGINYFTNLSFNCVLQAFLFGEIKNILNFNENAMERLGLKSYWKGALLVGAD